MNTQEIIEAIKDSFKIVNYVEENYINKILEKKLEIEENQDISSTNEITFELN